MTRDKDITSELPPIFTPHEAARLGLIGKISVFGVGHDGMRIKLDHVTWCNLDQKVSRRNKLNAKGQAYLERDESGEPHVAFVEERWTDLRVLMKP